MGKWETLQDVESFPTLLRGEQVERFPTKVTPAMGSVDRGPRTAAQLKVTEPPQDTFITPGPEKKKRGRPVTKTPTSMDTAGSGVQQVAIRERDRPRKIRHRTKGALSPE